MIRTILRAGAAVGILTAIVLALNGVLRPGAARAATPLPDPILDESLTTVKGDAVAVFAGGCFWGIQAVFEHVKGVKSATSGYAGGTKTTPSYEEVSSGATG